MRKKQKIKTDSNSQGTPALTFITQSTEIKADMNCDVDIRIAGLIEGDVHTKKKVILTDSGKIKGAVISEEAEIYGEITGNILVANKLTLRSTAVVEGEISAKILSIEDGAQLKGSLKIGPEVKAQNLPKAASTLSA